VSGLIGEVADQVSGSILGDGTAVAHGQDGDPKTPPRIRLAVGRLPGGCQLPTLEPTDQGRHGRAASTDCTVRGRSLGKCRAGDIDVGPRQIAWDELS